MARQRGNGTPRSPLAKGLIALAALWLGSWNVLGQIIQEYYVPVPENQGLAALRAIYTQSRCNVSGGTDPIDPINTYISISILREDTILYYDQWEDGYETNAGAPTQSSTKIWGDGNPANGAPPGVPSDILAAGSVIVLQNNVQSTTRQTVVDYDGGDRISSTFAIAMSRAFWATGTSTLHAGALEMYPTKKWGRNYTIPVGENFYTTTQDPFEYTAAFIMAKSNNTLVQIDADNNGSYESSVTLQQGGSHLVSGLRTGAKITSSSDVQVDLATGDLCDNYESRFYVLFPNELWSNTYYAPITSPTTSGKKPAVTFLYNPGASALTVGVKTSAGVQPNITVPAGGVSTYTMTTTSGAKFTASTNFYALCHQDHYASNTSVSERGHNHNAGFTLVPQASLTQQVLVGLGLGKDPTSSATGNYSPVYLLADMACGTSVDGVIRVYIDYDNNGTDSGTPLVDAATGRQYDVVYNLVPLVPKIVQDTDGDQTGMFAWISDPNPADQACAVLTAVWTQNGNTAPVGAPAIDVSTTVPSTPNVEVTKTGTMLVDPNLDGMANNGDVIRYRIDISNAGLVPLANVVLTDIFPSTQLTYVANTTRLNLNNGSAETVIADNGSGTAFPLDGTGYTITQSIPVGGSFSVYFNANVVNAPAFPAEICNTATATAGLLSSTSTDCTPASPNSASVGDFAWRDADADGVQDAGETGMAGVQVRLYTSGGAQIGATVTTGSNGAYLFSQLAPGAYYLSYTAPAGYGLSPQDAGGNDAADSDANPNTSRTADFTLVQATADLTRDVGIRCLPIVLTCPANRMLDCVNPNTTTANTGVATAVSPCGCSVNVTFSDSVAQNCGSSYARVISRTWTATDGCGNTATCVQTITVQDTTAPTFSGVGASATIQCTSSPSFSSPTVSDNCDTTPTLTFSDATVAGSCPQAYVRTRTWTTTDDCGNVRTASQSITVVDTTQPNLVGVPAAATVQCTGSLPAAPTVTATDNCDTTVPVTLSNSTAAGSCPQAYTLTRTWTATDDCGNVRTGTQVVSVVDTTQPTLAGVPAAVTAECSAIPAAATVTASDNCDTSVPVVLSTSTTAGACPQAYTLTRTWTATDDCGNVGAGSQAITVVDTTKPSITAAPAAVTVQCSAIPAAATITATDNCDTSVPVVLTTSTTAGSCPQSYVLNRRWTATDDCGNARVVSQDITVQDTTQPVLSGVPAAATVQCGSIPASTVTATDNCDTTVPVVLSTTTAAGGCPDSYTLTRTWTATDDCGNVRTGSQVLTVVDSTQPTLVGVPANASVECDAVPAAPTVTATDNCDTSVSVAFSSTTAAGSCPGAYTLTRTWTATDNCNNVRTGTQVLTVVDSSQPTLTGVPASATVACDTVPAAPTVTATDNCDTTVPVTFSSSTAAGACPQSYVITRTWTAADDCGNTRASTQTVTVSDTVQPVLAGVPAAATIQCGAALPAAPTVTATDNCDTTVPVVLTTSTEAGSCPGTYVLTRTWTATDDCNNVSTGTQAVTVSDTTKPDLVGIPAAITVECSAIPAAATVTATDNCDTTVPVTMTTTTVAGTCPASYVLTRRWLATDDCGNARAATQAITVIDTTQPVLVGVPAAVTVECSGLPAAPSVTATDNCDTSVAVVLSSVTTAGSCPQNYTVTRTWTATDDCGNARAGSQVISVVDTVAPVISGVGADSYVNCGVTPVFSSPAATDACAGSATLTFADVDTPIFGSCEVGNIQRTRTWTATDPCGNTATATQTITVRDTSGDICYALADGGPVGGSGNSSAQDLLVKIDKFTGETTSVGYPSTYDGESLVYWPASDRLFTFNANRLVWIDPATGASTQIGPNPSQIMNGSLGALTVRDIDGLTFDATVNPPILYASFRRDGTGANDVLLIVNTNNGLFVSNAFGPGNDYLVVQNLATTTSSGSAVTLHDVDDLAHDPSTGTMYAILNNSGAEDHLATIDLTTGSVTDLGDLGIDDAEGLSFYVDGSLFVSTGSAGASTTRNRLFDVNKTSGLASVPRLIDYGDDYEGLACYTSKSSLVGDKVWLDGDRDGVQDAGEPGIAGVTVSIYRTFDNTVVQTKQTDANGEFSFVIVPAEYFLEFTLPGGYSFTTPNAAGSSASNDSDADTGTGRTAAFFLSNHETDLSWDAGLYCGDPVLALPPDATVTCPNSTAPDATGTATATSPCGCPLVVTHSDMVSPTCATSRSITRTWTATDECGNASTGVQIITVVDNTAPVLSGVPAAETVECDAIPAAAAVTATDTCDGPVAVTLSSSSAAGACPQGYTLTRTWTSTDACGNSASASQVITVRDTTQPVLAGVPSAVSAECSAIPTAATVTATDNCDTAVPVTLSSSTTPGSCPQAYTLTRTWTATDDCGNTRTGSQVISVVDTSQPTLVGVPSAVTAECNAIPSAASVTATDNCDTSVPVTLTSATVPGACPQSYTLTRTWTATDDCGNVRTGSQVISVVDTTQPVLAGVPAAVTAQCSSIPSAATVTASDNCDTTVPVTLSSATTPGACPQAYTLTRTWTATDDCGNARTGSQVITVVDTTKPNLVGTPANVTVECSGIPAPPVVTATDNCDTVLTVEYLEGTVPGLCPQSYLRTRRWRAIDDCGNVRSFTQTITVVDTTQPVLAGVPAAVTVECSDPLPSSSSVTATDNCDTTVPVSLSTSTTPGACPQAYTLTRTWTAADDCGNTRAGSQVITVVDTTLPALVGVPAATTAECSAIPAAAGVTATDNCDTAVPVTLSSATTPGACPNAYTLTRTWSASDDCGNTRTASQVITVVDTTQPDLVGVPANAMAECNALPAVATVTATDNCDTSAPVIFTSSTAAGVCLDTYTITRTWTASDDCGNFRSASQEITVVDTTQPVLVGVPAAATVECSAIPTPATVTATDNCDTSVAVTFSSATTPGACADAYTITRTWTGTDNCGNARVESQVLTVVDTTQPVLSGVPAAVTAECSALPAVPTVTAADNCDTSVAVSLSSTSTPGGCGQSYTLTRTWTATDNCGNTSTGSQVITVVDTTKPDLVDVPAAVTVECDAIPAPAAVTATDNCDTAASVVMTTTTAAGSCPASYVLTRRWLATDACGNNRAATQAITVVDTTQPTLVGVPAAVTVECSDALPAPAAVTATDNCDTSVPVVLTSATAAGACPQAYTLTRTWTATDDCGNARVESQVISVVDTTGPVLSGAGADTSISCEDTVVFTAPTAADNCGATPIITSADQTLPGECPQSFVRIRTWTATDDCGNSSSVSQSVTVSDTTAPEILFIFPMTLEGNETCHAVLPEVDLFAFDECDGDPIITQNPPVGTLLPVGTNLVEVTVTDHCGNFVSDTLPVVVVCNNPDIRVLKTVYLGHDGGAGCPGLEKVYGEAGAPVTYCFFVINNGYQTLTNVTLTDPALGISPINVGTLASTASTTRYFQSTITSNLLNTASVSGTPNLGAPVTDTDTASVELYSPEIVLQKTVAVGANAACPGLEQVSVTNGAALTYCFTITNAGDSVLQSVTLTDESLGMPSLHLGALGAGQTVSAMVNSVASGSFTNTASVSGLPPMGSVVVDTDTAIVLATGPGIRVEKTVYAGHDSGGGCPGHEVLAIAASDPVTYCFRIRNVGDATLSDVVLDDPILSISGLAVGTLNAGQETTLYSEVMATASVTNTAMVTGTVSPGVTVADADVAEVGTYTAGILLGKKVFAGHGAAAAGCSNAVETLVSPLGEPVTYCFEVTNTGNAHLNDVTVVDNTLGLDHSAMNFISGVFPLAPGQKVLLTYQALAQQTLINTATAGGVPVNPSGLPIFGLASPQDSDSAEVQATGDDLDQN